MLAAVGAVLWCAAPAQAAVSTGDSPQTDGVAPPTPTVAPSESGIERDGEELTGDDGSWPLLTDTDYIWLRCSSAGTGCTAVTAAGDNTYTLTATDVGMRLKFRTRGTALSGDYRELDAVTGIIAAAPPVAGTPTFTAPPHQDGQTLTASPGTWGGTAPITFAYQWRRCTSTSAATCTSVGAPNSATYQLKPADVGKYMQVRVTGTNGGGTDTEDSAVSASAVSPIPTANTAPPVISGTARQGEILSASTGTWTGTQPLAFTYLWERCDPTCSSTGATSSSYAPSAADVGKQLKVTVTATGAGGTDSGTSALTAPVAPRPSTTGGGSGGGAGTTPTTPGGSTTLRKLSPFPIVAIGGRVIGSRVLVSLLRVSRAPRGSVVTVTCRGRGCPFRRTRRRVGRKALRIKALERRLRSGTVITIVVRKGNAIGKYTRLRIRRGAPPARIDRCIRPGAKRPSACP